MLPMALPVVIASRHDLDRRALERPVLAAYCRQQRAADATAARRDGLRNDERGSDFGPLMAGATVIVAPRVLVFLAAQRWFIDGLTMGATK
jgi:multiple sugar transport system permease protein